jgi:hypothetical protein
VTDDWSFVWTSQFLVGTVIAGLLLGVVSQYIVRALDHISEVLPASFRRAREEESLRIQQLTNAAISDNALYAALVAEASRLRLHQLLSFFIAFVCHSTLLVVVTVSRVTPTAEMTIILRLEILFLVIFLLPMGFFHYASGLENGKRARRLDTALRAVQRNLILPIMD